MPASDPLENCTGFDWDEGNTGKNWDRHRVTPEEAEDVFFQEPLIVRSDARHSKYEKLSGKRAPAGGFFSRLLFAAI